MPLDKDKGEPDIIDQLMRAMKQRTEVAEDDELKTVFREFTTELKKLNEGMAGDRVTEEQLAEHEELSRRFPAMKSKPPRPGPARRRQAS
jgi:hypothetical protein